MHERSAKAATTAETIFNAALDLPPESRAAHLSEACKGDISLRRLVEELLRAHEAPSSFLPEKPASVPSITEKAGDFVGPYKLVEKIGEGGFGVVYVAEQTEPVRRRVALKIIKLGMDTRQVVGRFEAERQALAMMDHPNIAKVLDAGAMESGRPYFVMELVRGEKITEFCDRSRLSVRQRLELFAQICHAVQHAHQKGIIHRDLKPSNILVTVQDGVPVPKVIDFGIAKATQEQLTDKTIWTGLEQLLGTPAYMSPEQVGMSGKNLDTRSDIYSAGVLLYELLTGRTPFGQEQLLRGGLDEMRRIIREQEPARPSSLLTATPGPELAEIAARRRTDPIKLIGAVRGDLDWIVMRCLEKERERRYETANGLAMDIQRHLTQQPVLACPPSAAYRLRKLAQRNKGTFAAAGAVTVVLLIGAVASAWQAIRATKAERKEVVLRRQAEADEKQSKVEAEKNRVANEVLGDSFVEVIRASYLNGNGQLLRNMMEQVTDRIEESGRTNQPEAKAYALSIMGRVYLQLENFNKAVEMQQEALDLRLNSPLASASELADSYLFLAEALWWRGNVAPAETNYQTAIRLDPKVCERSPGGVRLRGCLSAQHGRWEEAAELFAHAIELDPEDDWSWCLLMPVLVHSGRIAEYKTKCHEMFKRFGRTRDPSIANRTAKSCLLLPSAVEPAELSAVIGLSKYSIMHPRGFGSLGWRQLTFALAEYRQGQLDSALEVITLIQKELPSMEIHERNLCEADAYFVLAMVCSQLRERDKANEALQRGLEVVRMKIPKLDGGDLGPRWYDVSMTYLFLGEAGKAAQTISTAQAR